MEEVECLTLDGSIRSFPKDRLRFRPAAYAIIVHEGKVLLLKMRHTGKYHLPGGGIEIGERIEAALKREAREETGLEIEIERFARFEELFFYYDPSDRAYHGLQFYYVCRPRTFALLADDQVDDTSAGQPRWVPVQDLRPDQFQAWGETILEIAQDII